MFLNPYKNSPGNLSALARLIGPVVALLALASAAPAAVWNVSTFGELRGAALGADPGDEILIAPGSYHVTSSLYVTTRDLVFRGVSGNRDDVVLYGNGMNTNSGVLEGFWTAANGIELHNLTIKDFWHHGVHVCDDQATGNLADDVVISNVKIQNCGERYIKGSGNGTSSNVLVENVHFLQTEAYLPRFGHSVDEYNYIGGIDAMHTDNWIIRDNRFEGIMGAANGGRGAIFLWVGATNPTIERNVIVGCAEGINLGNGYNPTGTWHVEGGIVRNNFIGWGGGDNRPVQLGYTKDVKFYNNTIYTETNYNRAVHVYDTASIPTTNLVLENNLIRGAIVDGSTGAFTLTNNITGAAVDPTWFVDPLASDLHLTPAATAAIDQATTLPEVPKDIDRGPRPYGDFPDMGADEYGSPMGDINYDGKVDGGDYTIWADNYGQSGVGWSGGDLNGDGVVDGGDYTLWADNYGYGTGGEAAIPEPMTLALLGVGGVLCLARKRR